MTKNWWFKFDFKVWRTDSDLRRCSFETRGFWLECLCVMHESDAFKLSGSYEELGWLIGCSPDVVARCCVELKRTNTADVTLGNGNVTLLSRRMKRDLNVKKQTRLRVQKHRSNADVTVQSKESEVISKKKEENHKSGDDAFSGRTGIERSLIPINPSLDLELHTWLAAVAAACGAKSAAGLPKRAKWDKVCMTAIQEQRDLAKLLKIIEAENQRLGADIQFFSPETCLQKLQMNGHLKNAAKLPSPDERLAEPPPPMFKPPKQIQGVM